MSDAVKGAGGIINERVSNQSGAPLWGGHKQEVEQFDFHIDSFWNEKLGMEIDGMQHVELRLVGSFSRRVWELNKHNHLGFYFYCLLHQ